MYIYMYIWMYGYVYMYSEKGESHLLENHSMKTSLLLLAIPNLSSWICNDRRISRHLRLFFCVKKPRR